MTLDTKHQTIVSYGKIEHRGRKVMVVPTSVVKRVRNMSPALKTLFKTAIKEERRIDNANLHSTI